MFLANNNACPDFFWNMEQYRPYGKSVLVRDFYGC